MLGRFEDFSWRFRSSATKTRPSTMVLIGFSTNNNTARRLEAFGEFVEASVASESHN